jgi:UDP-N-acetylglucosamine acyltransferase
MPKVHSHSVVDPSAQLADDVEIGPFCVVGPSVRIGAGCKLLNSVTVAGYTTIGENNVFFPNCVIGTAPQDKKFKGETTYLEVGSNNIVREAVTMHSGTEKGGGITRVGSNNLIMVNAHIGHDAQIGNNCILSNNIMIAGHVLIHDNASLMGGTGVHHFVTIGEFAFTAGYAQIHHDAPPFCKIDGQNRVRGVNAVGLKRAGVSDADINALEDAERELFSRRAQPFAVAMAQFDMRNGLNPYVKRLVEFLRQRNDGKNGRYRQP